MAFSPNLQLFRLFALRHTYTTSIHNHSRLLLLGPASPLGRHRHRSTKTAEGEEEEVDLDKPFKFSTSRAATWKARNTYGLDPEDDDRPWYQPPVVCLSVAVFLVYFCVLREENETDERLKMTLYDHIEGLEKQQLELSLKHASQMGNDTEAIANRLREIQEQEEKK